MRIGSKQQALILADILLNRTPPPPETSYSCRSAHATRKRARSCSQSSHARTIASTPTVRLGSLHDFICIHGFDGNKRSERKPYDIGYQSSYPVPAASILVQLECSKHDHSRDYSNGPHRSKWEHCWYDRRSIRKYDIRNCSTPGYYSTPPTPEGSFEPTKLGCFQTI